MGIVQSIFGCILLCGVVYAFYTQLSREIKVLREETKLENEELRKEFYKQKGYVDDLFKDESSIKKDISSFLDHLKDFFDKKSREIPKDVGIVSFDDSDFTVDEGGFIGLKEKEKEDEV